jgi:hypothetical protein
MKRLPHDSETRIRIRRLKDGSTIEVEEPRLLTRKEYREELRPIQAAAINAARLLPKLDDKGKLVRNADGEIRTAGGNRHERRARARIEGGRTYRIVYGRANPKPEAEEAPAESSTAVSSMLAPAEGGNSPLWANRTEQEILADINVLLADAENMAFRPDYDGGRLPGRCAVDAPAEEEGVAA